MIYTSAEMLFLDIVFFQQQYTQFLRHKQINQVRDRMNINLDKHIEICMIRKIYV